MRHFLNRSVLFLMGIICVSSVDFSTLAQAETLNESALFFRIYVAFKVDQKAAQAWLPASWKAVSLPKGPFKGANLYVMFDDKFIVQDGEGKPHMGGKYCLAVLIAFGKNEQTGEFAPFVTRIYWPYEDPHLYKNAVKATVSREATVKGSTAESGAGSEVWKVKDSAGGIMEFRMDYQHAVPKRQKREFKVRSSVNPDFFRLYKDDLAVDVVKSTSAGIDRVKNYKFSTTISELAKTFDGSEQLVGISVNPCRVRQAFLP
jgi:hypothetical protein